jgi:hypothetical protein
MRSPLAGWLWLRGETSVTVVVYVLIAIAAAALPRILAVGWFTQDWRGALLHPLGI